MRRRIVAPSVPMRRLFALVPKATSGGLVPEVSPNVAAALTEFALLGGNIQPAAHSSSLEMQTLPEQLIHQGKTPAQGLLRRL